MSLREQLKLILPEVLPPNPKDAIKGTQLIELVKEKLEHRYSDATLRYHFSIMSCDPSSPIAKVEQGQGYYLRTTTLSHMRSARHMISDSGGASDYIFADSQALSRANKFRAIVARQHRAEDRFPYELRDTFGERAQYISLWQYPDVVLVDWDVGDATNDGIRFNEELLTLQRSFGSQPFTLRSVKLKLSVDEGTYLEDFYQCLSNSRWAHYGELVIAEPVEDERVLESFRALSAEFGIGVSTLGLNPAIIDQLPEPSFILEFDDEQAAQMIEKFDQRRIASPRPRPELDWKIIRELRRQNPEFEEMFHWLTSSLDKKQAQSFSDYKASTGALTGQQPGIPDRIIREHGEQPTLRT